MKKAILTTFICSVIAVSVALTGYIIYDKVLNNDEVIGETYFNTKKLPESNYTFKYTKYGELNATAYGDVSKYSNIFEYFNDMKLESIKLEYATNRVKEETIVETIYHRDIYTLTQEETENFLLEMKSSKQKLTGGFGPSINAANIYVTYKINDKKHTTKLMSGMWMLIETTDGNIYKIIDNNMPKSEWDVLLVSDKNSNILDNIISRLNNK